MHDLFFVDEHIELHFSGKYTAITLSTLNTTTNLLNLIRNIYKLEFLQKSRIIIFFRIWTQLQRKTRINRDEFFF